MPQLEHSRRLKADTVVAIASSVIALCALVSSIYEGRSTRRHDELSLMPHLVFSVTLNDQQKWTIWVGNYGQGPAFVDDFRVYVDGHRVPGEGDQLWPNAIRQLGIRDSSSNWWKGRMVIPVGGGNRERVLTILDDLSDEAAKAAISRLDVVIDFHSEYSNTDSASLRTSFR